MTDVRTRPCQAGSEYILKSKPRWTGNHFLWSTLSSEIHRDQMLRPRTMGCCQVMLRLQAWHPPWSQVFLGNHSGTEEVCADNRVMSEEIFSLHVSLLVGRCVPNWGGRGAQVAYRMQREYRCLCVSTLFMVNLGMGWLEWVGGLWSHSTHSRHGSFWQKLDWYLARFDVDGSVVELMKKVSLIQVKDTGVLPKSL